MSETNRPTLRVESLEARLALSTAGTTAPLPPPNVIVFGGDAATAPAQSTPPENQLAFGGDPISPAPLPPTGPIDTVIGGSGNDVI
jgi:hypothetical protein